jgi:DNA-binding GntR family transcriptional regulator
VLSELSLSRKLDVSRTPIHDALRQLARDGLVAQRANRRAVVTNFSATDVFDIFEMRKLLEGEAARRAAGRIDRPALQKLAQAADKMDVSFGRPGAIARWAAFDEMFHATIAAASGSPRLEHDIRRYRMLHGTFNRLGTTVQGLRSALAEHRRIIAAMERRDAQAAAEAMVAHIHEWQAYFVARFSPVTGGGKGRERASIL